MTTWATSARHSTSSSRRCRFSARWATGGENAAARFNVGMVYEAQGDLKRAEDELKNYHHAQRSYRASRFWQATGLCWSRYRQTRGPPRVSMKEGNDQMSALPGPKPYLTPEEYLALERRAETKRRALAGRDLCAGRRLQAAQPGGLQLGRNARRSTRRAGLVRPTQAISASGRSRPHRPLHLSRYCRGLRRS